MRRLCLMFFCAGGLAMAQGATPESVFMGVPFVQGAPVREQPEVPYPPSARLHNVVGKIIVAVLVDEDGMPLRHRVLSADPPLIFDSAVKLAIPQFRFAPAERDGKRVTYETHLTMYFKP